MLDLADLRTRLEAQLAAVVEAEAALARVQALCGLVIGPVGERGPNPFPGPLTPVERVGGGCCRSERVLGPSTGQQSAMRTCPGCGTQFTREAPAQKYCDEACRVRLRNKRAYQAKRARRDEAERQQTVAIIEQNTREGYDNLPWSNGHAEA
jgi:hypothetical protein